MTAWGVSGDIPVPNDYNGDATTEVAVYRPSMGTWFVQEGGATTWGMSADVPVAGDYDGDGATDVAVYRPSTGTWFVKGGASTTWGVATDLPLPLPEAIRRTSYP